jgi:hypothetical protein
MHKVNAGHLKRNAYLYIRQSTPRQVLENTESTKRQYALRQRDPAVFTLFPPLLLRGTSVLALFRTRTGL